MIYLISFIVSIFILFYTIYQNRDDTQKYNEKIDEAHQRVKTAEKNQEVATLPVFDLIQKQYGDKYFSHIIDKKIAIGMPSEIIILCWGKPEDVKTEFYKNMKYENWYYGAYTNRLGNTKYITEVHLENNELVGWKDL